MKKFLFFTISAIIVGVMVGCSSENENIDISFSDLYEDIKGKISNDMDGELAGYLEIDLLDEDTDDPSAEIYEESMQLDRDQLANGRIIAAAMNVNADEIILIEAKEETQVDAIEEALERQKDQEYQIWETYLPDQFEKVKNNIIKTNGKYLLYVTYEDPEAIENIFDNYFE